MIWEKGIEWDDELPENLRERCQGWCLELPLLQHIKFPRCIYMDKGKALDPDKSELHGFCDSSLLAYGAVIYVRYQTIGGETGIGLVTSKSRVAPLKKLTLPRLELMGALVLARLMQAVRKVIKVKTGLVSYWCDSEIVLHWIQGSAKKWKPFVANRVEEIQAATEPEGWRYCPGATNPADKITRGMAMGNLETDRTWLYGPPWLILDKEQWPVTQRLEGNKEKDEESVRVERRKGEEIVLAVKTTSVNDLFDPNRYSSIRKIVRITAWILRFTDTVKGLRRRGSLSCEELERAENYWIRTSQGKAFSEEVQSLRDNNNLASESSILQLNPFLDPKNLLRVGGRMQQADQSYAEKHPLILSPSDRITRLLIEDCHKKVFHHGLRDTLTEVRERFWILKGRQTVKSVLRNCLCCKRFNVKAARQQVAPLPRDRITEAPPFEITGVDFAGPVFVKEGRRANKAYITLFTCGVIRAIHLELVPDLSTESFLMAFKRFISRRGVCSTIYCDNALTFKRANKDLLELWNSITSQELKDFFGERGVRFKFIVERAPWHGGFYERLVRSVKTALKKAIGRALLRYDELETVLIEVEASINSRPLTYMYDDVNEPVPLTPAQLLIGHRLTSLPTSPVSRNATTSRDQITRRMKYREAVVEKFWKRWRKEYLSELSLTHKTEPERRAANLRVDDVVLINDEKLKKQMWKLGKIAQVQVGRDGKVRSCLVKLPNQTVIRRPIQLLHPLELS